MSNVLERRGAYKVFMGQPEVKRPLGRSRRVGEDSIKIDLKAIRWNGVNYIHLAQYRSIRQAFVIAVTNFRVPLNVKSFLTT